MFFFVFSSDCFSLSDSKSQKQGKKTVMAGGFFSRIFPFFHITFNSIPSYFFVAATYTAIILVPGQPTYHSSLVLHGSDGGCGKYALFFIPVCMHTRAFKPDGEKEAR